MNGSNHIIEKVVVEINTGSRKTAEVIKDNVSAFLERELFPRLEQLLDKYHHSGGLVRFNSLNLEIATLRFDTFKNMEPEIIRRLAEKLESSVGTVNGKKVTDSEEKGSIERISASRNREDTFLFFLGNGYLPWFGRKAYIDELTTFSTWEKSVAEKNDFIHRLVNVLKKKPEAVDRLVLQFDPEIAALFLAQTYSGYREVEKKMLSFIEKQTSQFRRLFLKFLLLIFTGHETKYLLQTARDLAAEVYASESSAMDKKRKDAVFEVKAIIRKAVDIQLKTKPEQKDELSVFLNLLRFPEPGENEPLALKPDLKMGRSKEKRLKKDTVPENGSNGTEGQETISAPENAEWLPFFEKEEGEIAVTNAGLVLLHPFLKPFFETVDISDEHGNINEARRHLAVQLVHYLAAGEEDFFESDLVFCKFLCGVPLEMPVPRANLLTQSEKNEASQLLKEVIKHWGALKNTSLDGLRQMFLQRNGKLFKKEKNYKLIVERKAQDILLDKLGWNISLVKIPWLQELLYVDW